MSMASSPGLNFRGKNLRLPGNVMGLTPLQLSGFIGMEVHGLLGTDVVNEAEADGILGNEILQGLKSLAYMPGRNRIVME